MRFKSIAATALLGGLLAAFITAPPASAESFADTPTVEEVAYLTVDPLPPGTKTACQTPTDTSGYTCPVLNWAGLRYWFLSRTDNNFGWHVAVFGKNNALLGHEYLGGNARYVQGLVVDSAAQQVRVIGQEGHYTEFSFSTLESIVPEASLDTGVALSTPTAPTPRNAASAAVTVDLHTPSIDPGGEIVVETTHGDEVGRDTVPDDYTGGDISISIDLSLLGVGSNDLTARYLPPAHSPLKASLSDSENFAVAKARLAYTVTSNDPGTEAWPMDSFPLCEVPAIWTNPASNAVQVTATVSETGDYTFDDQWSSRAHDDGSIVIFAGPYDRNDLSNCLKAIDDFDTVSLRAGRTYTILLAGYGGRVGDFLYEVDGPGTLQYAAAPVSTTATLTTSIASPAAGETVDLTASLSSPGFATFSGTVEFFDGATSLGAVPIADADAATMPNVALPMGTHTLTAAYTGPPSVTGSTTAPVTVTVSRAVSTVSVQASPNPVPTGDPVTLEAVVTSLTAGANLSGAVEFFDGATSLGTGNVDPGDGTVSLSGVMLPTGTHRISAVYSGNTATAGSTILAPVTVEVVDATSMPLTSDEIDAVPAGGIIAPATAHPGDTIRVEMPGVPDGQNVTAWLHSAPVNLGGFATVADGAIQITIPKDAVLGDHRLVVLRPDRTAVGWQQIEIVPEDAPATLSATGGSGAGPLLAGSVLALLAGAGLVLRRRPRV